MLSWIGNIDPDEFYYAQHRTDGTSTSRATRTPRSTKSSTPHVETDQDARKALYDQAATIIVDEASYIYLYNPLSVDAWSNGVSGYTTRPTAPCASSHHGVVMHP
jgi:peptide/nickel transport system substrate-binding protein